MTFDKKRVLADVQGLLEKITIPGTPASLVKAGCVQRIIAHEGEVSLVLSFPREIAATKESLKRAIEEGVARIPGVEKVQILEKLPAGSGGGEPKGGAAPSSGAGLGGREVPGVRRIIAVASGKGGVGKSTIAVNLAIALARTGAKVGLLDSDVYGPSVPKMLGLEGHRPEATDRETIIPIDRYGVRTMSIGYLLEDDSPVIWRGPMVTGLLRQFLFQVEWGDLDYLVLDLPPGTGDAQLTLVQSIALDGGIIVTTPQDVALLDVQRGIQMFARVEVPILGIVENMSAFECPHCGQVTEIFLSGGGRAAAERYGVPFLGSIPLVAEYVQAGDRGTPVVIESPDSALARTIESIARGVRERLP